MTPLGIQIHAHIHVTPLLKILATGIILFVVRGDKGVAGGRGKIKQPELLRPFWDKNSSSSYMARRVLHSTLAVPICICQARWCRFSMREGTSTIWLAEQHCWRWPTRKMMGELSSAWNSDLFAHVFRHVFICVLSHKPPMGVLHKPLTGILRRVHICN